MFTKYPGKLFLMGEYAIMEPGSISVVSAVDHYLNITVEEHKDFEIHSSHGKLIGSDVFTKKIMPHVHASLKVLNALIDFKPFKMTIESELEVGGKKIGFGSSGVVVVGVLDSLLKFHDKDLSRLELFKLACLVQLEMEEFSSGGDLAATIFRDTVAYQSYDVKWLKNQDFDVERLIHLQWPMLDIYPLKLNDLFSIEIGWTGTPHSTNVSLQQLRHKSYEDEVFYNKWVDEANIITKCFIDSVHNGNFEGLGKQVEKYQVHMKVLESWLSIDIVTEKLNHLNISTKYPSKVSGSGGGDCGIVFLPQEYSKDYLDEWKKYDIKLIEGGMIHEY